MNMKVENEMALPTTKSVAVMLLEPYAGKLARTVLRGESSRKGADLLDPNRGSCFLRIFFITEKATIPIKIAAFILYQTSPLQVQTKKKGLNCHYITPFFIFIFILFFFLSCRIPVHYSTNIQYESANIKHSTTFYHRTTANTAPPLSISYAEKRYQSYERHSLSA